MIGELGDLYQEVVLDHNKRPRNFEKLDPADRRAVGYNPLCGDHLTVYVALDGPVVRRATFQGSGCALSKASASLMTEAVAGKSRAEIENLFRKFHAMVTGQPGAAPPDELGKLSVFSGVSEFPARVKCVTLAWHTLNTALEGKEQTVSTEYDEPELGAPTPSSPGRTRGTTMNEQEAALLRDRVIEQIRTCYDPEIPVNIYELGLVYDVEVTPAGAVSVLMTLTSPACPVAGSLPPEVEAKIKDLPGVTDAKVEVVWDPPWNPTMMSEAARLQLNI